MQNGSSQKNKILLMEMISNFNEIHTAGGKTYKYSWKQVLSF